MDITIKNIPEECEDNVKIMALIAVERFLRNRDMKVTEEIKTKFERDIDTIRVANGLKKKFEQEKEEQKDL